MKIKTPINQKFGRLTVIEESEKGQNYWKCRCDCGNEKHALRYSLTSGNALSCGCLHKEGLIERNKKHLLSHKTRLYGIWARMRQRCCDSNCKDYKNYGARGITRCKEWDDFKAFYDWSMLNGYEDSLSIDRKDNDGNYEPSNCRWSTSKAQTRNRSISRFITYNNQTKTLAEWSEILHIEYSTLKMRIRAGWSIEKSFNSPIKGVNHENTKIVS